MGRANASARRLALLVLALTSCSTGNGAGALPTCPADSDGTPPPRFAPGELHQATQHLAARFGAGVVEPVMIVSGQVAFASDDGWSQQRREAVAPLVASLPACAIDLTQEIGPEIARWQLADGFVPNLATRELRVDVLELACASGGDAQGRIIHDVEYGEHHVAVRVRTVPLAPATCQGHDPTPHVLVLDEPLGGRELLDGGQVPASAPDIPPSAPYTGP